MDTSKFTGKYCLAIFPQNFETEVFQIRSSEIWMMSAKNQDSSIGRPKIKDELQSQDKKRYVAQSPRYVAEFWGNSEDTPNS